MENRRYNMTNVLMAATFIEQMVCFEEQVAHFYRLCASRLPDDAEFWITLAKQEEFVLRHLIVARIRWLTAESPIKLFWLWTINAG